ncbi:MAG: hypothetical protein JO061_04755 [Acidobacteriaceae bacterium]|nr:hypothetical protein [Acidobacteriaceae bacterium]
MIESRSALLLAMLIGCAFRALAGESPFFVTYTDRLEEPGNLEIESKNATGRPADSGRFIGSALEFEYGLRGWWTTEVYLDGQATSGDSTIFTGFRFENRFRLTRQAHWINPVLYVEFEDINGADKSLLEVVGHDTEADLAVPNAIARQEKQRELETKLLFGSYWRGWNFSENIIVEKNLAHAPWEFGYAVGVSRPLALEARPDRCAFCRENFTAGVEMYGGLGDTSLLQLRDTSHCVGPVVDWNVAKGVDVKMSPSFGITGTSAPLLLRFGISYEISQFARKLRGRQ